MKKIVLFSLFLFLQPKLEASEPSNVTGFLVDVSVINYMLNNGAQSIKIYAGQDGNGNYYYVLTGADGSFNTMPGQVYRQNSKGDCPPTCEFLPSGLAGGGIYESPSSGEEYINNYMTARPGVANCVKIGRAILDKVKATYPYIKVTFGSGVTVTGMKADGSIVKGGTYSDAGSACVCDM